MGVTLNRIARLAMVLVLPGTALAQFEFKVRRAKVEVHTFASQTLAYSDRNNFLTMDTSRGTLAFTEFGFNVSTQITDRLRVGLQLYDRNVGRIGNWRPSLDWAVIDYSFKDWLGVRAGKVKTVFGLYNETRDISFLHTWVLLPQSTYAIDMRGDFVSHRGGEVYGKIPVKNRGGLSYAIWGGTRSDDPQGGFRFGLLDNPFGPIVMRPFSSTAMGADLRWSGAIVGLTVGASVTAQDYSFTATQQVAQVPVPIRIRVSTRKHHTHAFYAQYIFRRLRLEAEYRKTWRVAATEIIDPPADPVETFADWRYGYAAAAFRISDRVEVGAYHSRFYPAWDQPHSPPTGHVFDQAFTARVEINRHMTIKAEGHLLDGYSDGVSCRGFYRINNPGGLEPKTKLLLIRLGYFF